MKNILLFLITLISINRLDAQEIHMVNKSEQIMKSLKTQIGSLNFGELSYKYDALEPYIDKMTMEIHYSKHYKAYYDNMINIVKDNLDWSGISLSELFSNVSKYPTMLRNNAGGYFNHLLFWSIMTPNSIPLADGLLKTAINRDFGSFDTFKSKFEDSAKSRFGSGWVWLVVNSDGKLVITSTPNQDNPYMDISEVKGTPVLTLDVWEHAYYLKFQNKRADYITAFWNVIDWEEVESNFLNAK
jgi:Fe-Mn family superoxide dismutase